MIDPRVASGLRDLTPPMMIPREQMIAPLPPGLRRLRFPADRDAAH